MNRRSSGVIARPCSCWALFTTDSGLTAQEPTATEREFRDDYDIKKPSAAKLFAVIGEFMLAGESPDLIGLDDVAEKLDD